LKKKNGLRQRLCSGEEGETFWKERLSYVHLNPIQVPEEKIDSTRTALFNISNSFLSPGKYLVEGAYSEFTEHEGKKLLGVKANSKETLESAVKNLRLPIK